MAQAKLMLRQKNRGLDRCSRCGEETLVHTRLFHPAGSKKLSALNGVPKLFFNDVFHIPTNTYFDARLISASEVFGVKAALRSCRGKLQKIAAKSVTAG